MRAAAVHVSVALAAVSLGQAAAAPTTLYVIVHRDNPTKPMDADRLQAIFTGSIRFWPHGPIILPFNASAGSPLRAQFDAAVLGMSPREVGRYWVNQKVRGGPPAPRQVPASAVVLSIVQRQTTAIAYVPSTLCLRGVRVVAVVEGPNVRAPLPHELKENPCSESP